MTLNLLLILLLNTWVAWRYSKQPIGSDEALWLLWPTTGARPFRDYLGGMIGYPLWMKALSLLVGKEVNRLKFAHHMSIGALALAATLLSGSLATGLLASAILQSGWLVAYQSWYDAAMSGLLLLMVLANPALALVFACLAVLANAKALVPVGVYFAWQGWWLLAGLGLGLAGLTLLLWWALWREGFRAMWYEMWTVTRRIPAMRPWRIDVGVSHAVLWLLPMALFAPPLRTGVALALGAALLVSVAGRELRANHLLPVALLAAADWRIGPALALCLAEWLSMGLYLPDSWRISYGRIAPLVHEARAVGQSLRGQAGRVFVNGFCAQIYCYAQARPPYPVCDELELRHAAREMAAERQAQIRRDPPDIIVSDTNPLSEVGNGYATLLRGLLVSVYGKL